MGKTESFEFLNELALAFRRGEKNARPQHTPILEGVRAVLAHLQSTGRLQADDEMRLTAEQAEDVRLLLDELASERDECDTWDLYDRVRALFPATDLAEHVHEQGAHYTKGRTKAGTWTVSTCRTCGAVIERATEDGAWIDRTDPLSPAEPAEDGWDDVNPNDPQGRTYRETAEEYYATPAEPAEKETKAEGPRKFRKRPVEVEAMHLDNHTTPEQVARWCGGRVATPTIGVGCPIVIEIDTLEGVMTAHPGDWIIKGTQGEFYPCKPAPFADTFEPASSPVVPAPAETAEGSDRLDNVRQCLVCGLEKDWRDMVIWRDADGSGHWVHPHCSPTAPTETGPWPSLLAVPVTVQKVKDAKGYEWHRRGSTDGWRGCNGADAYTSNCRTGHRDSAPFIAAEEGWT